MSNLSDAELMRFFEDGISLCDQWEQLAEEQLEAISRRDTSAIALTTVSQQHLLEEFAQVENKMKLARQALSTRAAGAAIGELAARRFAFVAAANRIFGANYRNAKALGTMLRLSAMYEEALLPTRGQAYDNQGESVRRRTALPNNIDREG